MTYEELVTMALEVTGIDRGDWNALMEVMRSDAKMNEVMKAEWNERSRDSEEAIRDYYRRSKIWFVNTFNHGYGALLGIANRQEPTFGEDFQQFMKLTTGRQILDYGGGFYNDTWVLLQKGLYTVTQAEVRGPVTDFLKIFFRRLPPMPNAPPYKLLTDPHATILEVDWAQPLKEVYDGIVTFETLEHLLDPKALTKHMVEHLKPGAPFFYSASFGAPTHAPYHVASNDGLTDQWAKFLTEIGMEHVWSRPDKHRQIWRRKIA